jgi:hypothetical protein
VYLVALLEQDLFRLSDGGSDLSPLTGRDRGNGGIYRILPFHGVAQVAPRGVWLYEGSPLAAVNTLLSATGVTKPSPTL